MCKKILITLLVVGVAFAVVAKKNGWSVKCSKRSDTIEAQISRLRNDVQRLDRVKKEKIHTLAVEEVQVAELKKKFENLSASRNTRKTQLSQIMAEIDAQKSFILFGDRKVPAAEAQQKAKSLFDEVKQDDTELKALAEHIAAREAKVKAMHDDLAKLEESRRTLDVEITNLETRLIRLRTSQDTQAQVKLNESELSRINARLSKIRTQIEVEEKKVELHRRYTTGASSQKTVSAEELQKIRNFLSEDGK